MPHDLVIRAGTVVDGTGVPGFTADIAIDEGRISEIGRVAGKGAREIDADGMIVTPGFIDIHTHMDAQLHWDPLGTCSSWQGVTTAVMGNCGFTLAPSRKDKRDLVVRNLERAEDIPAAAMAEAIDWSWESFADYLDAIEALPMGINYAANIGHSALRTWAMGERAFSETAREKDLAAMEAELAHALDAGAIGFSTSRSAHHETSDDRPVASRIAGWEEVSRLVHLTGSKGAIFELAQEPGARSADPGERGDFFDRLLELAVSSRAMVTFGVLPAGPRVAWEGQLDLLDRAAARGANIVGQSHSRGVSILLSFETQLPFDRLPQWKELRSRPLDEQKALLRDPKLRAMLAHAAHHGDYGRAIGAEPPKPAWEHLLVFDKPLPPYRSVASLARERGVLPAECLIDLALEHDLKLFFIATLDPVVEEELLQIMQHPQTVMSFSDAGAHASQIVDACIHSHLLAYWARDRQAFALERAVAMVTHDIARRWGFADRGSLGVGKIADINLIDLANLHPGMPQTARDLPTGAMRLVMKPQGILATLVRGEVLMEGGQHTGSLPGQLLRRRRESQ